MSAGGEMLFPSIDNSSMHVLLQNVIHNIVDDRKRNKDFQNMYMLIADITDLCHSYIDRYENIEDKDAVLHMSELFMFKMHSLTPLLENVINKINKNDNPDSTDTFLMAFDNDSAVEGFYVYIENVYNLITQNDDFNLNEFNMMMYTYLCNTGVQFIETKIKSQEFLYTVKPSRATVESFVDMWNKITAENNLVLMYAEYASIILPIKMGKKNYKKTIKELNDVIDEMAPILSNHILKINAVIQIVSDAIRDNVYPDIQPLHSSLSLSAPKDMKLILQKINTIAFNIFGYDNITISRKTYNTNIDRMSVKSDGDADTCKVIFTPLLVS